MASEKLVFSWESLVGYVSQKVQIIYSSIVNDSQTTLSYWKVPPFGFVYIFMCKKVLMQSDWAYRLGTTLSHLDIVTI